MNIILTWNYLNISFNNSIDIVHKLKNPELLNNYLKFFVIGSILITSFLSELELESESESEFKTESDLEIESDLGSFYLF